MKKIINLGKFMPSHLEANTIAEEFSKWLTARNIRPYKSEALPVRTPEDHLRLSQNDLVITKFHRDGLGKYAADPSRTPAVKWMLVWSNKTSTIFKDFKEITHLFQPYDVLLVDNHAIQHKAPPPEPDRFFIRLLEPNFPESLLL
jgi:hypothetical protein